ncbi:MAG: hypothetical protein KJ737_26900, partial [Proteobacteria bacterium]|nr:hypothetical protein [Pseudomonadota bacterium]
MNHFRFIADTKLAYILYVLCLFLFAIGCGGKDDPETETSSLVFGIRMSASDRLKDNLYTIKAAADNQITADTNNSIAFDCSQIGVHTVTAYIYNAENRLLIIGGPWLCSEHGGEIGSIPSGPDRRVIIEGRDEEGNIIVYGEKYVGTLLPNETSEAGIIKVYHFAVTDTRPENDVMISSSTVLLEWEPIPGAVRYHLQVSGTSDFSALIVDDDTLTTTSYLHTNASEKTTYYWRISAVDINDNKSSNSTGRTYHISEKITCFADMDRDGFGNPEESIKSFDVPDGYVEDNNDCNDSNASIHPGMAETYDDIDNNCSGENNEGFSAYYQDADHDGYGNLNIVIYKIEAPEGYVPDSTDFDDTDATRYPGAPELYDQKDNDGDGAVDEGFLPWYQDADNDGYGDAGNIRYAIVKPSGYVNNSNDCNDRNMSIHPGANEICGDSIDQNCDGGDEICPVPEPPTAQYPYYRDVDGDGYGNAAVVVYQTSQPDGYVANNTDCNDNDAGIHPGAEELYDDVDNNCSGENNEGFSAWYEDGDGDEYGNADMVVYQTSQPE